MFCIVKDYIILSVTGMLLLVSCRPESFIIDTSSILETYSMGIPEPSGLSYSSDKETLFTVSDQGMAYEISLTGETIRELPFTGDDLEGITVDPLSSDIYLCEEGKGTLIKLNSLGVLQNTYNILNNPGNSGLEGLAFNNALQEIYLLKEKSEGLLIKYSINNNTKTEIKLNFADDYSGIYYNSVSEKLWIVSDESRTLSQCTLSGVELKHIELPISAMEGVVVNDEETEAYVVSDLNKKLYKIDLTNK